MMEWRQVGNEDSFAQGGTRVDLDDETRLAVFRIEDDFFVIGDRCSHAEASLAEGEIFDDEVECPRHGSEFNIRTGEPGSLPATRPVPTYAVRVTDGVVEVAIEDEEVTS